MQSAIFYLPNFKICGIVFDYGKASLPLLAPVRTTWISRRLSPDAYLRAVDRKWFVLSIQTFH